MIGPGGGVSGTHLQDVGDHAVDSAAWVAPDGVDKTEGADVKDTLGR